MQLIEEVVLRDTRRWGRCARRCSARFTSVRLAAGIFDCAASCRAAVEHPLAAERGAERVDQQVLREVVAHRRVHVEHGLRRIRVAVVDRAGVVGEPRPGSTTRCRRRSSMPAPENIVAKRSIGVSAPAPSHPCTGPFAAMPVPRCACAAIRLGGEVPGLSA